MLARMYSDVGVEAADSLDGVLKMDPELGTDCDRYYKTFLAIGTYLANGTVNGG